MTSPDPGRAPRPLAEAGRPAASRKAAPPPGWLATALRRDVVTRSLRVAAVVGTLLVAINYTDRILGGDIRWVDCVKMLLTYLVPYGVATYAAVGALRARG